MIFNKLFSFLILNLICVNQNSFSTNVNASFSCLCESKSPVLSSVLTPNNSSVSTWDRTSDELTPSQISYCDSVIANDYPYATYVSSATRMYNCHSYAWYMQNSQYNLHWMDNPTTYVSDNSYYQVYAGVQVGDIICYIKNGSKIHSGRIYQILGGSPNGVC